MCAPILDPSFPKRKPKYSKDISLSFSLSHATLPWSIGNISPAVIAIIRESFLDACGFIDGILIQHTDVWDDKPWYERTHHATPQGCALSLEVLANSCTYTGQCVFEDNSRGTFHFSYWRMVGDLWSHVPLSISLCSQCISIFLCMMCRNYFSIYSGSICKFCYWNKLRTNTLLLKVVCWMHVSVEGFTGQGDFNMFCFRATEITRLKEMNWKFDIFNELLSFCLWMFWKLKNICLVFL